MSRLGARRGVTSHDVVVHQRGAAEEREAAGWTEDAADHMLRRLLEPVSDRVLELLVPHHWPCKVHGHIRVNNFQNKPKTKHCSENNK